METTITNPEISLPARFTPVNAVAFAKPDGSTEMVTAASPLPVTSGALGNSTNHIGNVFVDDVADGVTVTGSASAAGLSRDQCLYCLHGDIRAIE